MPDSKKFRTALVGCGGRGHDHIRAALATGEFELTGASDPDSKRLAALLDTHGGGCAKGYADFNAMLQAEQGRLDVVHICTQPTLRLAAVQSAIRAQARAIVLEKPMALTWTEAVAIEEACRKASVLLVVNHQTRDMSEWRAMRNAVASGQLGDVTSVRTNCSNLLNQGTHMLDLVWYVLGEPRPKWAFAGCDKRSTGQFAHPCPRTALALIEFEGGKRCSSVFADEDAVKFPNTRWNYNMEVLGSKGTALASLGLGFRRWDAEGQLVESFRSDWDEANVGKAQQDLSRGVPRALRDSSFKHPQRCESALVSFALVEAICRSALSGLPVELPLAEGPGALERWANPEMQSVERGT